MGEGVSMLRLGVSFTLAAMVGSGTELFIRSWLEREAGLSEVGLYNAGYLLTVTYVGLVFAAMENDYFPRLSATHDVQQTNEIVNRQMEILLLLLAPLLSVMILGLPWIIRLLLSADFLPIVTMAQIASVAMVLKAATLPVAYLTSVGIGRNGYCHSDSPLARPRDDSYVCTSSFRLSLSRAYLIYNRSRTGDGQHGSVYQYVFPC